MKKKYNKILNEKKKNTIGNEAPDFFFFLTKLPKKVND